MGSSISHETYESINEDFYDGKKYYAKFKDMFFEEGACRYAFMGTLYGNGPRNNSKCVTKVFKDEAASKLKNWVPEIAASKRAFKYAQHFQEKYFPRMSGSTHEIEFLIPLLAQMKNISAINLLWFKEAFKNERYVNKRSMVAIEPFIEGSYEKFNSNGGYEQQGGLHSIVNTFSHWTWHVSGHKYMVCDLQGVKSGRKYILTDPAIHSAGREFGATDLGAFGMEKVLGNHTCNNFCMQLGLRNPYSGKYVAPGLRSTTYSFQVTEEEMMRANQTRASLYRYLPAIFE